MNNMELYCEEEGIKEIDEVPEFYSTILNQLTKTIPKLILPSKSNHITYGINI